jgi:hypothetical protein
MTKPDLRLGDRHLDTPARRASKANWQRKKRATDAEYRAWHAAYMCDYNKRKRVECKAQFITIYGGKCERCGMEDERVLTIDHVNGGGRQERRRINSFQLLRRISKTGQRDPKYRLLCFNCNWLAHLAVE